MSYSECKLPEYPVQKDMWDALAFEKRPIVVYGMGNGADKLIARFEKYGIEIADFFASDGFVRGHSFHGKRVKSFSEIKSEYSDFVIVLSFASNREEVIDMLSAIDSEYDMYVPDMPVAGEEYFDREFYNAHYSEIAEAYRAFSDTDSRSAFASIVTYKLTGKMSYILSAFSTRDELYRELPLEKIKSVIDAGAYNGDTVKEAIEYFPSLKHITAIEPDPKNFKKLLRYVEGVSSPNVSAVNAAVWDNLGNAEMMSSGNRNSSLDSTSSFEYRDAGVTLITLDSLGLSPDYVKYDVEGAELRALVGSSETIRRSHPTLLVSLYHRSEDIFRIVNYLTREYPFYRPVLRRLKCLPAWEIDLLMLDT